MRWVLILVLSLPKLSLQHLTFNPIDKNQKNVLTETKKDKTDPLSSASYPYIEYLLHSYSLPKP